MNITLFNTVVGSTNTGDLIIQDSFLDALPDLFDKAFVIQFATHLHNFGLTSYNNPKVEFANSCDYKFISGTNLLSAKIANTFYQWPVGPISAKLYRNSILAGVGTTYENVSPSLYSRYIYNHILRKDIIHSVRDEQSAEFLRSMGFQVINTGCPTMWKFTPEFCKKINVKKQPNVVISLSGNGSLKNEPYDCLLLDSIRKLYKKVYFWVQTIHDERYLYKLLPENDFVIIRSLKEYQNILRNENVDYVGTRLHGGVFAIQNEVRAFIIEVDHRARGFKEDFNLNVIERSDIENLADIVQKDVPTDIKINIDGINEWCSQFNVKCAYF